MRRTDRPAGGHREFTLAQNGWLQYSVGRSLPCLTMISDGETLCVAAEGRISSPAPAADAFMACGPTTTEFDHMKSVAAMTAIAPTE
jgi:hypothetical protein